MHYSFRNVNYALPDMTDFVLSHGEKAETRNGPVMSVRDPVTVSTKKPMERVLLCPIRRANPFLNLLDGLSILSKENKVKPLANIVPRFKNYSDDGKTLRAHYGARLAPQLQTALNMLRTNPGNRQVVMSIWQAKKDLNVVSVDIPCNLTVVPRITGGCLDLTVFNRSNDLYWGMLGANIVQFSFLQEYMAAELDVRVGTLNQISTNLHIYLEFGPGRDLEENHFTKPRESYPPFRPLDKNNLRKCLDLMFRDLMINGIPRTLGNKTIDEVAIPMLRSWKDKSVEPLKDYPDCDWFQAARMWWSKV